MACLTYCKIFLNKAMVYLGVRNDMKCTYQEQYQSKLEMECNCFFISDLYQKESLFISPVVHIVTFSKPFITFLLHVNIYGKYFLGLRRYHRLVNHK